MNREQFKVARVQLLPLNARYLPSTTQVVHIRPMLLGDAGIHAIVLQSGPKPARTYVATPLSPRAMVVFGDEESLDIAHTFSIKVAMESTVVVDTVEAPIINGSVAEMWSHQLDPSGAGLAKAVLIRNWIEDVPTPIQMAQEVPTGDRRRMDPIRVGDTEPAHLEFLRPLV